ncbi:MAG: hypothetical protein JKX93_10585 [Rhizobiaceae bacterium]|nr:hypothetical protein [Rhizobiaceae bacterium]
MTILKRIATAGAIFAALVTPSLAESLPTSILDVTKIQGKPIWGGMATITPLAFNDQKKPAIVVVRIPAGAVAKTAHATNDGNIRFATVLSGTMFYSDGDTVEQAKETAYAPGSVLMISSGTKHWLSAREGEVTLMLTAVTPANLAPPVMAQHAKTK